LSIYNITVSVGDSKLANRVRRESLGTERFTSPALNTEQLVDLFARSTTLKPIPLPLNRPS